MIGEQIKFIYKNTIYIFALSYILCNFLVECMSVLYHTNTHKKPAFMINYVKAFIVQRYVFINI